MIFKEENIISLRTAYVCEHQNRNVFSLRLSPMRKELIENWDAKPNKTSTDHVYLYRRKISDLEETKLKQSVRSWELQLIPLNFENNPEFRFCWSDSGNSVALYLNGEPWAFIYEGTRLGYSKGIIPPSHAGMIKIGNQWNQELFKKVFF